MKVAFHAFYCFNSLLHYYYLKNKKSNHLQLAKGETSSHQPVVFLLLVAFDKCGESKIK